MKVKRADFIRAANYVRRKLALSVQEDAGEDAAEAA